MGWIFTNQSKDAVIRGRIASQESDRAHRETIAYTLCDDVLWSVVKFTAKEKGFLNLAIGETLQVICCDLLHCSENQWGYKSLDESAHPYYYSCPEAYLDMAPVQCQAWRDAVMQYHRTHP